MWRGGCGVSGGSCIDISTYADISADTTADTDDDAHDTPDTSGESLAMFVK